MTALARAIKKIATGPHLSKDLTEQEAYEAMTDALSGMDDVQAAIFLIALRMKRESNEENLGVYRALQQKTAQQQANIDHLLLLADPFNGFNRHCPINAFLPALLAASGLPCLSQGVKVMGPKFGVTHSQVLNVAGLNTELSIEQATQQLNDPAISWAFLDQAQATPSLFALQDLRTRMIKRPCLATLEKLVLPVKAKGKNHLMIGFVHKAYPDVLAWVAHHAGFDSTIMIRGIEGGVVPTLRQTATCFRAFDQQAQICEINPADYAIEQSSRGVLPEKEKVTAEETAELGYQALSGQSGVAFDSLVYGAAIALWHCGLHDSPRQSAQHVRQVIQSGRARAVFQQAKS